MKKVGLYPAAFLANVLDDNLLDLAWRLSEMAERVDRDGAGPGSLTDDGLHYSVVTGEVIRAEAPALWKWAAETAPAVASAAFCQPLRLSAHVPSAVNVNVLEGRGEKYEAHTDSCPYTLLAFVTGGHEGGQLLLGMGEMIVQVYPAAGDAIVFGGDTLPHWVSPLLGDDERRITVPVALYPFGVQAERDEALDSHLYR